MKNNFLKYLLLTPLFTGITLSISAKIAPYYKEVIQRGYSYANDTVIFPDGSKCSITDFNNKTCGAEWMTDDYCIEEGNYVWDEDKCCDELSPYLEEGTDGHPVCAKKESWFNINYFSFWVGLFIPFALFAFIVIQVRNKLKDKNRKK